MSILFVKISYKSYSFGRFWNNGNKSKIDAISILSFSLILPPLNSSWSVIVLSITF